MLICLQGGSEAAGMQPQTVLQVPNGVLVGTMKVGSLNFKNAKSAYMRNIVDQRHFDDRHVESELWRPIGGWDRQFAAHLLVEIGEDGLACLKARQDIVANFRFHETDCRGDKGIAPGL